MNTEVKMKGRFLVVAAALLKITNAAHHRSILFNTPVA